MSKSNAGPLTQKQENFCLAYLETDNASEAYRRAYNAEHMKASTINRNAKALLDHNKIATRLAELRAPAIEAAQVTLSGHLNDLKQLRDKAAANGVWSAAISAEIARGKAAGLYVERQEISGPNGVPIEVTQVPSDPQEAIRVYQQIIRGEVH